MRKMQLSPPRFLLAAGVTSAALAALAYAARVGGPLVAFTATLGIAAVSFYLQLALSDLAFRAGVAAAMRVLHAAVGPDGMARVKAHVEDTLDKARFEAAKATANQGDRDRDVAK